MVYFIQQKSGHRWDFVNYKYATVMEQNGLNYVILDIQEEGGKEFRTIRMPQRTIEKTNVDGIL